MKTALAAAVLTALATACDVAGDRGGRANAEYQKAMDSYAAGDLEAAEAWLKKSVSAAPGDASARFQLACLQHDHSHDLLSAICNYREYLLLSPSGEKARIASERLARAERDHAAAIAAMAEPGEDRLAGRLAAAEKRGRELEAELAAAKEESRRLSSELERMRRLVSPEGAEEEPARLDITIERLLDEDEGAMAGVDAGLAEVLADAEAEEADAGAGAALPFAPDGEEDGERRKRSAEKAKAAEKDVRPPHPDVYVVEEGDTLYKIASRFYGSKSAWKKIRDANKTTISTDGRVNAGQEIVLPK